MPQQHTKHNSTVNEVAKAAFRAQGDALGVAEKRAPQESIIEGPG